MKTPGFTAQLALYSRSSQIYREYSGAAASGFAETSEKLKQVSLAGFPPGVFPQGGYTGINNGFNDGFPSYPFGPISPVNVFGHLPSVPVILGLHSPCDNFNCPEGYICIVSNGSATCATCESVCGCSCVNGACPDYQNDNLNCGGCAVQCFSDCCNGTCCPFETACCNGICMDGTDYYKCENCGPVCADNTQSCCSGTCTNTQIDPQNCGQCGNVCPLYIPGWGASYLNPVQEICCDGQCFQSEEVMLCGDGCFQPPNPPPINYGNRNYIIGSDDPSNTSGLSSANNQLTFRFQVGDTDLVGDGGFAIQNNATAQVALTSGPYSGYHVWCQYVFQIYGQTIYPQVQYATGTPDKKDHDWIGSKFNITLPENNTLPANTELEVVITTDSNGNVNGGDFWVYTNGEPTSDSPRPIPSSHLWPYQMTQLTTNLVCNQSCFTSFTQGETNKSPNSITYESKNSSLCFTGQQALTAEGSNAIYGFLGSCCTTPGSSFSQPFIIPSCDKSCGSSSECLLVNGVSQCVPVSQLCNNCKSNQDCKWTNGDFGCV
jgi:hypothetical protein